jgi:ubiquinone/menaquinone biosynthesis C-methylase UbiE
MSTSDQPRREHPNTYFVQDRSNLDEMTRLQIQDQMLTTGMGGVLPEQSDPTIFQRVLDVGCGTGGWLIEAAKTYPSMSMLVGVDVSNKMLEYARAQAEAEQVTDRVEFRAMDALRMLEFPADYFDLVNQRFGASFLRKWDWPKILQEYQRVARPGGVIRVTEADFILECSSPALSRLYQLACEAFYQAGNYFTPSSNAVISELAHLLSQYGLQDVQTRSHILEFHSGTPEGQRFAEETKLVYRTMLPFLRKWTRVPDDYEEIYQQALSETEQPDFVVKWGLLTAWGTKRR